MIGAIAAIASAAASIFGGGGGDSGSNQAAEEAALQQANATKAQLVTTAASIQHDNAIVNQLAQAGHSVPLVTSAAQYAKYQQAPSKPNYTPLLLIAAVLLMRGK